MKEVSMDSEYIDLVGAKLSDVKFDLPNGKIRRNKKYFGVADADKLSSQILGVVSKFGYTHAKSQKRDITPYTEEELPKDEYHHFALNFTDTTRGIRLSIIFKTTYERHGNSYTPLCLSIKFVTRKRLALEGTSEYKTTYARQAWNLNDKNIVSISEISSEVPYPFDSTIDERFKDELIKTIVNGSLLVGDPSIQVPPEPQNIIMAEAYDLVMQKFRCVNNVFVKMRHGTGLPPGGHNAGKGDTAYASIVISKNINDMLVKPALYKRICTSFSPILSSLIFRFTLSDGCFSFAINDGARSTATDFAIPIFQDPEFVPKDVIDLIDKHSDLFLTFYEATLKHLNEASSIESNLNMMWSSSIDSIIKQAPWKESGQQDSLAESLL